MACGPTTWRPWSPRGSPERKALEIERLEITPGTPVAEHIRTGYTRTNQAVRVMVSIIPGDTLILEYKIPT
jgi:DNA-binding GntR family transcriptional regulator